VSDQQSWVSISSGDLVAQIDPRGAQLSTLRDRAGHDLMWNGDPSIWAGRAPLLFPIVGALVDGVYRLDSNLYHLSRHGFARGSAFERVDSSAAAASFRLQSSAATLAVYPFRFELEIRYALEGNTLSIVTWVRNLGDTDMAASFGYHPALSWPLPFGQPRADHAIEFATDEPSEVRRLDAAGLLTPERHATPIVKRRLSLEDALFQDDVIILDEIRSRFVTYGATAGPRIRVAFPDAPWLGIWTKPGADFICIEPWHGVADPVGYAGDFRAKPGVFELAPGSVMPIRMNITLLAS
jgi:galactose mutarotase-like enzyme